jgi:5'-methylthioadenosine phosphorylase
MADRIGIIGGSGLYSIEGVEIEDVVEVETPFGAPSGPVTLGRLGDTGVAFLPRHGPGHHLMPSEVPFAANIHALKSRGVRTVIAVSAVGSMREDVEPRHFVVPDQIYDRTKGIRRHTFFGDGVVGHIGFADPFCSCVREVLVEAAREAGATTHDGGTYVCIEGPQFSSRAESRIYRGMGVDVIGMTAVPEAKLAREAGICYATLAMVTDYDVWHTSEAEVTVEMVMANMRHNVKLARKALPGALRRLAGGDLSGCCCRGAGAGSLITPEDARDAAAMERLKVVLEE